MSAFVVGKAHIDAIVRFATTRRPNGSGLWVDDPDRPGEFRALEVEDADWLGRMLWAANVTSVEHRYPDTRTGGDYPGPVDFLPAEVAGYTLDAPKVAPAIDKPEPGKVYSLTGLGASIANGDGWAASEVVATLSPVGIMKACDCLEYQSCEAPDWEGSRAQRALARIRDEASRLVPGYAEADWEVSA